ncbi:MAG: MFS transporter [Haliscomenobacteraceae bacterium CHB4]|nr:MFS transporter [Haliscomenobacteraceae bacterium CHB4]
MHEKSTDTPILKNDPKTIRAWAMYDWANSVYVLVITSAIFPAYYNQVTRLNGSGVVDIFGIPMENTAVYSINMGLAFGIVALISPLLSSISDYTGNQKGFMRMFCYLGALGCMLLFWFEGRDQLFLGLLGVLIATVGYSGSIVFYNSYLPAIATEDQQDKVSARGFSYGYIGATVLLLLNLALIMNQKALGIADATFMPRLAFLLTGLWWLGFAQITFARLPNRIAGKVPKGKYLFNGYKELSKIWNRLKRERFLRTFLLSFFFYIMGVQTVLFMAGSFGEKEVHLRVTQLIVTILLLQFVGIAGAYLFAWMSKKVGNLRSLTVAVLMWIAICAGCFFIVTPMHFYTAAACIGLVMGGIQALSRSTYSKLIPKTGNNAGYFSFYDVCEKVAMMCGLVIWGTMDNLTGSMRNSIVSLVLWFSISLVLLLWLQRKQTRHSSDDADSSDE